MVSRKYELYVTLGTAAAIWGLPLFGVVMTLSAMVFLLPQVPKGDRLVAAAILSIPVFSGLAGFLVNWRLPRTIELFEDGRLVFSGPFYLREVPVKNIKFIKVRRIHSMFITVAYKWGSVTILNQFTDFHELITELKRLNPEIETVGC